RDLLVLANLLPEVRGRALLVHQLIGAYGLLPSLRRIEPTVASDAELRHFHTAEYIDFVRQLETKMTENADEADEVSWSEDCEAFGLAYDCPPFSMIHRTISYLAGASLGAARALVEGRCSLAINWFGGWHHGRRDEASGFCYTNDIVLAILTLLERFRRVLYIDLDLHHGDAVQDAFERSNRVVTLSLHKHEIGFFPGTGALEEVGTGSGGRFHTLNMPFADGTDDETFTTAFSAIITPLIATFRPEVLVVQCGADGLSGDRKVASFNLTLEAYKTVLKQLLELHSRDGQQQPVLLLGGGGYHFANTARLWTSLTALCLQKDLEEAIPEHDQLLEYGPSFELPITPSTRPNRNRPEAVTRSLETIIANIGQIKPVADCGGD
ncbi:Histone deacetylase 8, partial [Tyrophagus putrescentiae]